uniref:RNase H type-1 domain-containing protein n=1 Tax=Nelumbo nucifera TaxID=4432 RepID=A0A822YAD3_NELNU|nr:TPA_asm: hypothetical protein HUJ06_028006 [Nelumbo nucifera]
MEASDILTQEVVVIRNHNGSCVAACYGLVFVASALHAEVIIAKQGLDLAKMAGLSLCVLESDYQELVNAIQKGFPEVPTTLKSLLKDIMSASESIFVSFSFVNRNCNSWLILWLREVLRIGVYLFSTAELGFSPLQDLTPPNLS